MSNPLQGKSFSWYSERLEKCEAENKRLRDSLSKTGRAADNLADENERLRAALETLRAMAEAARRELIEHIARHALEEEKA